MYNCVSFLAFGDEMAVRAGWDSIERIIPQFYRPRTKFVVIMGYLAVIIDL